MDNYLMINFWTGERFIGTLKNLWHVARHILRNADREADTATLDIYTPDGKILAVFNRGFVQKNLVFRRG